LQRVGRGGHAAARGRHLGHAGDAHEGVHRADGQAAQALTLTLRFAGGTTWHKTRRLTEASAHDEDLRTLAYQLMDAAGLQRARLTGIALKGEDLIDADQVAQQITLDQTRESRLVAEEAMDRIRAKFGPRSVGPTTTAPFRRAS
ncbi:DinB/UmuC family translesion DNA polymerase, partial [Streptomyces sp. NPDC003388]